MVSKTVILLHFSFSITEKKESHSSLEQHESEYMTDFGLYLMFFS